MKSGSRITLALAISIALIVPAFTADAADSRIIEDTFDASALEGLSIDVSVGDLIISSSPDDTSISVKVTLHPRRGGIFSSLAAGRRQVEDARLEASTSSNKLKLEIETDHGDRRFEENWELHLPLGIALDIDLGVGDLELKGLNAEAEIEIGVGDAHVLFQGGNLDLGTGVGDIELSCSSAAIKAISAESGVGDVQIIEGKKAIKGEGMVSHSLEWKGQGGATLELESGVGDIELKLK